ncbi:MAG: thioredoxin family protein [Bacilli bacterium]|jgi:thiol-disulfide isomerase/thioredoxin|nr:thioredoxin family protein [Bacilli bacterium]
MKVLKFGAVWCPGCLIMKPRWAEIESELPWLNTIYFDYDKDKEAVEKWEVKDVLPVFIFVDSNNKEITRLIGEFPKKKLLQLIEKYKDK